MRLVEGIDALPVGLRFVVIVGVFDGVHRGHQRLLATLARVAREEAASAVVVTFEPHPEVVVSGRQPLLLNDPAERLALLGRAGVDATVIQPFDEAFRRQTAERFLERLTSGRLLSGIVMSPESAFGRDRLGTLEVVRRMSERDGWRVVDVSTLELRGGRVSSSRIRELLQRGRLADARALLGRPYAVVGEVVHGDGRGHELGFPTANLAFDPPVCLPADGVYAARASWGGPDPLSPTRSAAAVVSLGVRPTFGQGVRVLEVHLLDREVDLYGLRLRVEFARRLRGQRRFASIEALVERMGRDVARARDVLGGGGSRR